MFDKFIKLIQENILISIIIVLIILNFLVKNNKTIEKMSQIASTCDSNKYEFITLNQLIVIREFTDSESNKYYKAHLVDKDEFQNNFDKQENNLILSTPGDNNYTIKYDLNNLFFSYNENSGLVELDDTSKRFKFINAKEAGVKDAEDGDYLLSTESNKYIVQKDSFNLGFDKNNLILNTNLIEGKTKVELSNLNTSDFIGIPIFKLNCIN